MTEQRSPRDTSADDPLMRLAVGMMPLDNAERHPDIYKDGERAQQVLDAHPE